MTFFTVGILGTPRIFSPVLASSNEPGSIKNVGQRGVFSPSVSGNPTVLTSDSVRKDVNSLVKEKKENGFAAEKKIGGGEHEMDERMRKMELSPKKSGLKLLDEDWYSGGTETVKDYLDISKELIRPDGGPPRWFCPIACGKPLEKSPLMLFLPGIDGIGLALILHHKTLGRIFEVRCMHIPIYDRTPFEGLVKFVEATVKFEHALSPNKPIYLLGDSLGACLALAIAARNPSIDLVLILANPATSFGKSQLQPLLPLLEAVPDELHVTVPYLLSFVMGDPVKMAMASVETGLPPSQMLYHLSQSLTSLLPRLSILADIIPKETLSWKLKLLKSASSYANSRLHAVKAEVLVLASGNDRMLPSKAEAERLFNLLRNSKVRYFKDHGHTILLEDGINLVTVIKGADIYRRSRRRDYVLDYLPPTMCEFKQATEREFGLFYQATSPVMFSTLNDGTVVRGLAGIPDEGPVLLVGYHMLVGLELAPLIVEFLKEKKVHVRGLAHPVLFTKKAETPSKEPLGLDTVKLFGAVPVSANNFFRLLSSKSYVLLYPGGAREALHRKGEEYKLFWPDQPEFVRMAARFGATIIPFGAVGEDDMAHLLLDYDDLKSIPIVKDWMKELNEDAVRVRDANGVVGNDDLHIPALLPKIPGRLYYLFGKPIQTRDRMKELKDRENALVLYHEIKSEVEKAISYLKKKREEDPYRSILPRAAYQASWGFSTEVPTFKL